MTNTCNTNETNYKFGLSLNTKPHLTLCLQVFFMVFLSQTHPMRLCLLLFYNECFIWGRFYFPISLSGMDMPKKVCDCLQGSSIVGTGILSNNMRSPSSECYTTFWRMTKYSDTLHWSDITSIFDPVTDMDLITNFDILPNWARFPKSINFATEDAYLSLWDLLVFLCWGQSLLNLSCFRTFGFWTSLGTSISL